MSFFNKRSKAEKPKGINEISNKELKEKLAKSAFSILQKGTDFEGTKNIRAKFGYLFYFEGHGTEALFKIITDKTTAYFAVQGTDLMRLNLSEEFFQATVDQFLSINS